MRRKRLPHILKRNTQVKQQVPLKKIVTAQQRIEETEPNEENFFSRIERDSAVYSSAIDKLAINIIDIKREMVKQQQFLCLKYEELVKERDDIKNRNQMLIRRILTLNNELAENAESLAKKPQSELLQLLQANLFAAVEKEGVKKIPIQLGTIYDPLTCVAVPEEINNDVPEGTIVREITPGYYCGSKKLISAKVAVTKKGEVAKQ